jgi:hypothetical protein
MHPELKYSKAAMEWCCLLFRGSALTRPRQVCKASFNEYSGQKPYCDRLGLPVTFRLRGPHLVLPVLTDELTRPKAKAEESKLTYTLIEASSPEQFDFAKYKDTYTEKLKELIEKKAAGEEIVAPPVHEQTQIVNLMDALRQSLAEVEKGKEGEAKRPLSSPGCCGQNTP